MHKVLKICKDLRLEKRISTIIISVLIFFSTVSFISFINIKMSNIINNWKDKVYKGVTINNLDVSGLSRSALLDFLSSEFGDPVGEVVFRAGDKSITIPYSEIGITYDYDKAMDMAFNFSENLTYTHKINQLLNPTRSLNITLEEKIDLKDTIDSLYDKLSREFNVQAIEGEVSIINGEPVITKHSQEGLEVDKESLIRMLNSSDPSSLSDNGVNIDMKTVNPKYSSEALSKINGKISSYSTSYKSSSTERATNVELAANSINGVLLMPGESFSFNKVVGPRTRERGYKDAAIIVGNVYESGLGGGICQVSSTLHQAVVMAGIVPTQRRNHTLPTSYMPLGFDAVVAWGSIDYVFKNPYDFPILIDVSTAGRNLVVSIYGDVTKVNKTYHSEAEVYERVPYKTKYVNDNTLSKGTQVVQKNGVNGTRVNSYIVTKDKYTGEVLSKDLKWKDYYNPQDKIVRVGTK